MLQQQTLYLINTMLHIIIIILIVEKKKKSTFKKKLGNIYMLRNICALFRPIDRQTLNLFSNCNCIFLDKTTSNL